MNPPLRLSGSRSAAALVAALALAALTACGADGTDDTAADPASSPSPPESTSATSGTSTAPENGSGARRTVPATGSAGVTEATLLSATEGGGAESPLAFALDADQAVGDFTAQFEGGFADTVATAAAQAARQAPGSTAYGATASIGCEEPRSVAIDAGEAGFEVVAKLPGSTVQCLAPVTYVVLFSVPDA